MQQRRRKWEMGRARNQRTKQLHYYSTKYILNSFWSTVRKILKFSNKQKKNVEEIPKGMKDGQRAT